MSVTRCVLPSQTAANKWRTYYLCTTAAELPVTGLSIGDLAVTEDTLKFYYADSTTTWVIAATGTPVTSVTGTAPIASSGGATPAISLNDNGVTYAKIQDVTAASRLLGRGSAAGSGDPEEITVGSGLAMTGTTLSASASAEAAANNILRFERFM